MFDGDVVPQKMVDGWNAFFCDDLLHLRQRLQPGNSESVGQLWLGLLRFYTEEFDFKENVISIRQKKPLTTFEKQWTSKCIAIEDPFDLNHNLGAGVSRKMTNFIMKAFINGRKLFGTPFFPPLGSEVDYFFDSKVLTDGELAPNDRCCRICGKIGHYMKDCPKRRRVKRKDGEFVDDSRDEERRCFQCGDTRHVRRDCPQYKLLKRTTPPGGGHPAQRSHPQNPLNPDGRTRHNSESSDSRQAPPPLALSSSPQSFKSPPLQQVSLLGFPPQWNDPSIIYAQAKADAGQLRGPAARLWEHHKHFAPSWRYPLPHGFHGTAGFHQQGSVLPPAALLPLVHRPLSFLQQKNTHKPHQHLQSHKLFASECCPPAVSSSSCCCLLLLLLSPPPAAVSSSCCCLLLLLLLSPPPPAVSSSSCCLLLLLLLADANGADANGTDANRADANGTDANGTDANGTDANGTDANGADANGADANGADANGTDAYGTDANGTDANGTDAYGADANGADANGADANGADANGTDAYGTDAYGTDANGTDANGTDANGTDANGTDANGADANGTDAHGTHAREANLSDLKKENFSLKLRIYYMEEKNQDPDLDLHRENVELKVQLQGLIRELQEKDEQLQEKDEQLQGLIRELQEKDEQLQGLITELQEKDEQLQGLSTELQEKDEQLQGLITELQEKDEQLQGLITELQEKDEQLQGLITELQEKDEQLQGLSTGLQEKYEELGRTLPLVKILANQSTKENKQQDAVTNQLQEGLESRLLQEEVAKEEVTEEEMTEEVTEEFLQQLLQAQTQVQTLQNKIRISEDRNRLLLKRLGEMEVEVRTVRQEVQVSLYCREPEDRVLKEPSLLQQKTILDQELYEVKTEAQKTGKALLDLRAQNQELRQEVMSQHQETFDHRRGGAVLDMGYETCDRSETEAERDISSPEFDDLEMCLSLDHSADLWRSQNQGSDQDQVQVKDQDKDQDLSHRSAHGQVLELQLLVKHLQSELNRSKVQDPELTDLLDRVETLENQIKSEARTENQDESRTGHLVHLQARELSHLRQVLRESRSLVQILLQSLTEQLQGLADLQASGGEHGRTEQLQEIHQLTQRLYKKISLKQLPEEPEDKSELLAMRLSKELHQKDRLIQSLRSELQQDNPTDSDQSECSSYMSEELSSNQDTDLYSDLRMDQSQSSSQSEGSKRTEFGSMFSAAPPSAQSFPMMHRSGHAPWSGHTPSGVSSLGFSLDSALRPGLPHPSAFWETASSLSGSCPMPSHNAEGGGAKVTSVGRAVPPQPIRGLRSETGSDTAARRSEGAQRDTATPAGHTQTSRIPQTRPETRV
uniref:CCHC-type domain-containing protein n=1 Tax=Knipowitschia caucasica TaxID=637954 RepID=A0AAV2KNI6_KNICA